MNKKEINIFFSRCEVLPKTIACEAKFNRNLPKAMPELFGFEINMNPFIPKNIIVAVDKEILIRTNKKH